MKRNLCKLGGGTITMDETLYLCLIGKLWTERSFNSFALMETMKKLWCPSKGMTCLELGNNMFAFQFQSKRDMKRIKDMEPWHFNKHMLILQNITAEVQPSNMKFDVAPIWVRIYDLPINVRDTETVTQIGRRIGKVVTVDSETTKSITPSVRMKVEIPLTKPLKRGIKVRIGQGEPCWLPVTYERLPSFCYRCGKLGHTHKDCAEVDEKEEELTEDSMPYGGFMRASPFKSVSIMEAKNNSSMDHLRKELFTNYHAKTEGNTELRAQTSKQFEYSSVEDGVSDILDSLIRVQVSGAEPKEQKEDVQGTKEVKQLDETLQGEITNPKILMTNILHPTTKTLTHNQTHNTTPAKTPPDKQGNNMRSQGSEPVPAQCHIPNLIPFETLVAMVNHSTDKTKPPHKEPLTNPINHTIYHTSPPPLSKNHLPATPPLPITSPTAQTKHPIVNPPTKTPEITILPPSGSDQTKGKVNEARKSMKTWNRLTLKTPKIEGETVLMGKRLAVQSSATPNDEMAGRKKVKQETQATNKSTAAAAIQPRRSS